MITITVGSDPLNKVDHRLFGQFLERASFGEPGPEPIADSETGDLPPDVVEMMRDMKIPVVRFPGGTDIDYIDWRDLVSNVPDRDPGRPITTGNKGDTITNRFGIDEYFRLRDEVSFQTILVCNLFDGVGMRVPLRDAALAAAGLVAYANAPVGTQLPDGMPDWPSVRAMNGHPEPFGAEYFQIGNEWYGFVGKAMAAAGLTQREDAAAWYREVLTTYIDTMRAVDPEIRIIIDGHCTASDETGDSRGSLESYIERRLFEDPEFRSRVDFAAIHEYAPGDMGGVARDGKPVPHSEMTPEQWWYTWVAMPGHYSDDGECAALGPRGEFIRALGVPIACTEWNWNGWRYGEIEPPPGIAHELAAGLGAAGFLHGLIRDGDAVALGCQSLLLGSNWGITSIRVDPSCGAPPHYNAQGHATMFYANHHGNHRLPVNVDGNPSIGQPIALNDTPPRECVALIDAVATVDESTLYLHMINRHISDSYDIQIDLSRVARMHLSTGRQADHHVYTGDLEQLDAGGSRAVTTITSERVSWNGDTVKLRLPPHSANIVEFEF